MLQLTSMYLVITSTAPQEVLLLLTVDGHRISAFTSLLEGLCDA